MKFLIIHNRYSKTGGEERVVEFQRELLERNGHQVLLYVRSYDEIRTWRFGRLRSFFTALRNKRAVADIRCLVEEQKPDVAIVHNLFPVISPAILPVLKTAGMKVWMSVHNFRLVCPVGTFYTHGQICERCGTSKRREWNCLFRKCEGSLAGSLAYAVRSRRARKKAYYTGNIDRFMVLSDFQRDKLLEYGLPADRFQVIPNVIDPSLMPEPEVTERAGYVAFVGRLSEEKGVDLLFETARRMPQTVFKAAGIWAPKVQQRWGTQVPSNVELVGQLNRQELADLYAGAAVVISTSKCYEGFHLTVAEAMYYGAPVVVPESGGMADLVEYGACGLLYPMGSAAELAAQIELVRGDPELAATLSQRGREHVREKYNPERYYALLQENF